MTGVIHGIVAPCFIFWSSTEARNPAINQLLLLKYRMSCTFTMFSRFANAEEICMTKSRNSVVANLNVDVVLASEEGKMPSNEALEVAKDSGAPNDSDSSKIPDASSEIGNLK